VLSHHQLSSDTATEDDFLKRYFFDDRATPNHRMILANISGEAFMKSSIIKRSVVFNGHKTSVSLEDAFWNSLKEISHTRGVTMSKLVAEIDKARQHNNLSSAVRLFVLDQFRTQLLTNPVRWHLRAQEARQLAQKLEDPVARAAKFKMADRYSRLARQHD
jgi:predicted DNA-binding ribbon-helix-helix protein